MDPNSSLDALNLAVRENDAEKVERLLQKMNPNRIDINGWTCLQEAAAKDSYQSLLVILKHKDVTPLAETHEGHTALYLACKYESSLQTIQALLESVPDLANYGSAQNTTPLHISTIHGRLDVIQLLIDYGAMIDVQDFRGDTPLHIAAFERHDEVVNLLLHAGANPDIKNEIHYTPLCVACYRGGLDTVKKIYPFVSDINEESGNDNPLSLAIQSKNDELVQFLLENGADPYIKDEFGDSALVTALNMENISSFSILMAVTQRDKIDPKIILHACNPKYFFQMEKFERLLKFDLSPEFFNFIYKFPITLAEIGGYRPFYATNAPINSYLNICYYVYHESPEKFREFFYLFLMKGMTVDATDVKECPPLVYIHYCKPTICFKHVFEILREHGCNVDYTSVVTCFTKKRYIPDAILASLMFNPAALPVMLPHSLYCDPEYVLRFAGVNGVLRRIPQHVQKELLLMIGIKDPSVTGEFLPYTPLSLKHLSRQSIRSSLRNAAGRCKSTNQFFDILNEIKIPQILKDYLRFVE